MPPGTGICHQVNLEYIGQAVWSSTSGEHADGATIAYPDTLVGTDSHTTMVNGLGVLGWGVGGIEAEAAMLGQPVSMLIPEVVGFKLTGALSEGITATDLVLTVTQMLRAKGVVGRFVEFYGPGLAAMTLADRATIANMAPEYGATCGFFPVDDRTLDYLRLTGRPAETIALVEAYAKAQGMWRDADAPDPIFTDTLELDMSTRRAARSPGPKRPQDKVSLDKVDEVFNGDLFKIYHKEARGARRGRGPRPRHRRRRRRDRRDHQLHQHLEPLRAGRRRPGRAQGARAGPEAQAVGQDLARARIAGRHRLSRQGGADRGPERDGLQPRRLWLHHLHRQFGAARRADHGRDQRATISSPPRSCRATATSKAACRPTSAPTSSPRRRWSSPMR